FIYDFTFNTNSVYVFDPVQRKVIKVIPLATGSSFTIHLPVAYGDGKIVWFGNYGTQAVLNIIDVSDLNNVKQTYYNLTPSLPLGSGWDATYPAIPNPPNLADVPT